MGDRRRTKQLIILALCVMPLSAFAQRFAIDSRNYFDYGDESFVSSAELPASDSLLVFVNTASALFSFIKSDRNLSPRGEYFAVRDISVELRESPAGKILATSNTRDTIFASDFSHTTSKDSWHSSVIAINLKNIARPQTIELHTEIRDGFLSRLADRAATETVILRTFNNTRSVTAKDTTYLGLGDPIIFDFGSRSNLSSKNFGRTTEFSHSVNGTIPLAFPNGETPDSISIALVQVNDFLHDPSFQQKNISSVSLLAHDFTVGQTIGVSVVDSVIRFALHSKSDSGITFALADFHISGESLEIGSYRLDIKAYRASDCRSLSVPLELVWHDMPLSLQNVRDAVPPMQYILSDDDYSKLSSGSNTDIMRKLLEYWKQQDPTPNTAYNERMAEFYRRADYAYFNFARNMRQLDGALTDRGKIYILFGAPSAIRRSFLVGEQPVEIWTYSNTVKKIFKFLSSGSNEFKLVEVKPS